MIIALIKHSVIFGIEQLHIIPTTTIISAFLIKSIVIGCAIL